MKVVIVQMSSTEDKKRNLDKSLDSINRVAKEKPDLVVFPEYQMFVPDYSKPEFVKENAETVHGEFISSIIAMVARLKLHVLINVSELDKTSFKPFNTSFLISDLGIISGRYRKMHLFDAYGMTESCCYEPAHDPAVTMKLNNANIGVQICYDLRYPEPSRVLRLQGSHILVYQAGWFSGNRKLETWKTLLRARAMENGAFVIGAAQCGPKFTGHSMVVSPYGDVLDEAENDEVIISTDLDLDLINKYAKDVALIEHRRRDLYDVSGL